MEKDLAMLKNNNVGMYKMIPRNGFHVKREALRVKVWPEGTAQEGKAETPMRL